MSNGTETTRTESEIRLGKLYTGGEYKGELLNYGGALKYTPDEIDDEGVYRSKGLYGFASAAGDTSYYEVGANSMSRSVLRNLMRASFQSAIASGSEDYDRGMTSFKRLDSGDLGHEEFIESWGTEPKKEGISDKLMKWFGKD